MSAVRTMKTIGAANIAANAISTAWLPIVVSIRRRRTSGGEVRGVRGRRSIPTTRDGARALTPKEAALIVDPPTRGAQEDDDARERDQQEGPRPRRAPAERRGVPPGR